MKIPLGKEVGLGPGHIVLDGDPAITAATPHFRPMPIVAKRSPISATAALLLILAVAEMGNRGHNRHGPKRWGAAVPLSRRAGTPSKAERTRAIISADFCRPIKSADKNRLCATKNRPIFCRPTKSADEIAELNLVLFWPIKIGRFFVEACTWLAVDFCLQDGVVVWWWRLQINQFLRKTSVSVWC